MLELKPHCRRGSKRVPQREPLRRLIRDRQWDRMLDALDRYLLIRQDEHLAAVDVAGRSGRR